MHYKNLLPIFLFFSGLLLAAGCNTDMATRLPADGDDQEEQDTNNNAAPFKMYVGPNPIKRHPEYIATEDDIYLYDKVADAGKALALVQREEAKARREFTEAIDKKERKAAYERIQQLKKARVIAANTFEAHAEILEKKIYVRDSYPSLRNAPKEHKFNALYDSFSGYKCKKARIVQGVRIELGGKELLAQAELAYEKASKAVVKAQGNFMEGYLFRKKTVEEKLQAKSEKHQAVIAALESSAACLDKIAATLSA